MNLHQFSIAPPTTRSPITPSTSRTSSRPTISIPRTPITTMMTPWLLDHDHIWSHPESWTDHTHTHPHRADDYRWSTRDDDRLVVSGTAEALFSMVVSEPLTGRQDFGLAISNVWTRCSFLLGLYGGCYLSVTNVTLY